MKIERVLGLARTWFAALFWLLIFVPSATFASGHAFL
jgi:hypothetical protein